MTINVATTLFVEAENAVATGDWAEASRVFPAFQGAMRRHFALEEDILFLVIEERTSMASRPTMIMRNEHYLMSHVLNTLSGAIDSRDSDRYLG